jgi:hypothetical protein
VDWWDGKRQEARGGGKVKISGLVDEWTGGRGRQKEVPGDGDRKRQEAVEKCKSAKVGR